jgi:Leucine-rich repeat (LRR) protein
LSDDAYLEILYKSNLDTIKELCNTDKHVKELCKTHGNSIIKNLLKRSGSNMYGWKIGDGFNYFKGFEGHYVTIFNEMLKYLKDNRFRQHSVEYFLNYAINPVILSDFSDITREFLQKNIKNYYLNNLKLKTFPTHYFCNLRILHCHGNLLTSLPDPKYFPNLQKLICYNNKITEIPNYKNLVQLNCGNNRLSSLPILPELKVLICEFNNITKIENYPKLQSLNCNRNNISKIEYSSELVDIDCGNNNLTDLPKDLLKLRQLRCFNNKLTEIHYYPNLEELDCPENNVTNIIGGPELKTIDCSDCNLTSLNSFPKLNYLDCSNNNITEFNESFPEVLDLDIHGNNLHELHSNNLPKLKNLTINEDIHIRLEDFTNLNFINGTSVEEILEEYYSDNNSENSDNSGNSLHYSF